jgi:hypothetical protein
MKKIIIAVILLVSIMFAAKAQPGSGGFGDEPVDAPIDGGILLLAAAGVAYGKKKLSKK